MLLVALHIVILAWLSRRLHLLFRKSPARLYYWPALVFKLVAGIALGLLYFVYYGGGDTIHYHEDASTLANLAIEDPSAYWNALKGEYPADFRLHYQEQERALLTAKIYSPFYIITANNYWITACYISFLAFLSLFFLVHRLIGYRPALKKNAPLAFLFWPSFVFWTSGLLKESLAIICIAFIVASVLPYLLARQEIIITEALLALLLFAPLFYIKYYYAGLLAPILACLLLAVWLGRRYNLQEKWRAVIFLLSLVVGVGLATLLHPNMYPERFLQVWVDNYYLMVGASAKGDYVNYNGLEASWSSVLSHAPRAILTGLYEPLFRFDLTNFLQLAAAAENIALLLLTLMALLGWGLRQRFRFSLLVAAVLLYVLVFALIMGIASPNFGAIVRYRINYQPFFTLIVLTGSGLFLHYLQQKAKDPPGKAGGGIEQTAE